MSDEMDVSPEAPPAIDLAYLRAKTRLEVKRSSPDLLEDPDFASRLEQKLQSRVLVSKDKRSFAVLDQNGTPMPGAGGVALQRLAAELVRELEAERGPSVEALMEAKRADPFLYRL
jgi:hypothetical protein